MTIFYIANARIPTEKAHGIQIMKMCEVFAATGNNVRLILPKRINKIKDDPYVYHGVKRNFIIIKLPCLDFIIFDRYINHLGMLIENLTFDLFVLLYILFHKSDIIYTRDKFLSFFTFFKKNIIFEAHTSPKKYYLYSHFFNKLKKTVVITEGLRDLFIEKGIKKEKIIVAPDGVDLEEFNISLSKGECREKLNLPLNKKIVLYTGHLYKWKGVDVLAEATEFLSENINVYFVGGIDEDVERFKNRYGDIKNIKIIGRRSHKEIPYWLKSADILILPNSSKEDISKYWTSPLKLFEYMASGTPIIASDLPSIREILNNSNAALVSPDSPEKLSGVINKIINDEDLCFKISGQAHQDIKKYTWEKRAIKILEFINDYDQVG
jgi:glycosyltransferase involved in cell wall biosynthesis